MFPLPRNKDSKPGKAKPGIRKIMTNGDCSKINFLMSFLHDALSDLQFEIKSLLELTNSHFKGLTFLL